MAQVGDVPVGDVLTAAKISVVEDDNAGAAEDAYGREGATITAERVAALAETHAEIIAAEVVSPIEAGAAFAPVAAIPTAAGRPGISWAGVNPAGTAGRRRRGTAANDKDRAAAAVHPETFAIHSPAFILHAGSAAYLALQADLVGTVTAAVIAVAVVRFAGDGLS